MSTSSAVVNESDFIPKGLTELATELKADAVVVGSSSSGLLGRVTLGSVTGRLVHTARCPWRSRRVGTPATRADSAAHGGLWRPGRGRRPHRQQRRVGQQVVDATAHRLVHGAAGAMLAALRAVGRRTRDPAVGEADHRRYRQAAQHCSLCYRAGGRRGGDRQRSRLARGRRGRPVGGGRLVSARLGRSRPRRRCSSAPPRRRSCATPVPVMIVPRHRPPE